MTQHSPVLTAPLAIPPPKLIPTQPPHPTFIENSKKTKLTNHEIKKKYEHTRNKYYNHVRYGRQRIRNSPMNWEEGEFYDRSAVGKLKMTIDDVYLVLVAWKDVEPLDNEIKNNKNIIIVKKENLKEIYTLSLVSRPHFYNDILEQIKDMKFRLLKFVIQV
ncbi:hypothetical protein C2G38_2203622 [Gigaspora rosea]|uniref:Uncharacterized protein n=1 Tax=Gigaspora rosea TaxID=44941 RepID=A0A397UM92_9GLOM|nr:hypothetical protein C2G38_2203622 [Gigaspora rosea]